MVCSQQQNCSNTLLPGSDSCFCSRTTCAALLNFTGGGGKSQVIKGLTITLFCLKKRYADFLPPPNKYSTDSDEKETIAEVISLGHLSRPYIPLQWPIFTVLMPANSHFIYIDSLFCTDFSFCSMEASLSLRSSIRTMVDTLMAPWAKGTSCIFLTIRKIRSKSPSNMLPMGVRRTLTPSSCSAILWQSATYLLTLVSPVPIGMIAISAIATGPPPFISDGQDSSFPISTAITYPPDT